MCDAIRVLAAKNRGAGNLQGIGIGVPGIIDMETGMVRESPNLPDWAENPVRAEIESLLGTRVVLENDANLPPSAKSGWESREMWMTWPC